jgi:hypothetical protein
MKRIADKLMWRSLLLLGYLLVTGLAVAGQEEYLAASRYDYYTTEQEAEVLVWAPESRMNNELSIEITRADQSTLGRRDLEAGIINRYKIPIEEFNPGENKLIISYYENEKPVGSNEINVIIREYHYNEVKIDRMSGGLIVEDLPFFPFGFYTYSPVQEGLPAEEVVKGFNMMSPYQKIESRTFKERKAYMDRCAALGMKVNYNLLSVAGGGGVGSGRDEGLSRSKRMELLRKEIEAFRDHPALLSWYISDEPVGQGVPPDSLIKTYELIKELDPYHPVSVVFMTPSMAEEYSHVMDIVMADPYPIPHGSVKEVGVIAAMLSKTFFLKKPVWIVPQAFGGNEWWKREPTRQELRAMTYLALVNDAMGIQYFIRHGLNAFPKSTVAWNECGAMALEMAEITPYLFSEEGSPAISSSEAEIQLKAFAYDGSILVTVVNTAGKPLSFSFILDDIPYRGSAGVLFENRTVDVVDGKVEDLIDTYGTRLYKIRLKTARSSGPKVHPKNIFDDESFEDDTGLGIPASCYASPGGDKGATYFTDTRTTARGERSLRMTTPSEGKGMRLSFYPERVEPMQSYSLSIQAKALPGKYRGIEKVGFLRKIFRGAPSGDDYPEFTLSMGGECHQDFTPGEEWQEYAFSCMPEFSDGKFSISPVLELNGKGTAWFDLLQLIPDMDLRTRTSRDNNEIGIYLASNHNADEIYYTTDGSMPDIGSKKFTGLFSIDQPTLIKAIAWQDGRQIGYLERYFVPNYATGRFVEYKNEYSSKYNGGLKDGLVDGIFASPDFKDGKWQGFEGEDFDVIINLKTIRAVKDIELRFLENRASWIFLPEEITITWSADGREYFELPVDHSIYQDPGQYGINTYDFKLKEGIGARYIRIKAKNIGTCPEGHPGAGGKAWLFTDEIIIR